MTKRRHGYSLLLILLISTISLTAVALQESVQRLDPALRMLLLDSMQLPESEMSIRSVLDGQAAGLTWSVKSQDEPLELLVKLNRVFRASVFHGLRVKASTGTILGLSATLQQLMTLLNDQDVVYIEQAHKASPTLDVSIPAIAADIVHNASPAVTGAGVIIGATDTGIDYTHDDFRYDSDGDGFEESSRILGILDQSFGLFGIEYTWRDIETDLANGHGSNEGIVRERDTDGHGTHVMSIAAGDGSSSPEGFVGVAPEAWIVMVKTTYYTSDILAGVEYIFDLADELGLPAVVNLSLGGHDGPHDGTSLFEQGIDELVYGTGRVIVVSAGNEGDQAIHASDTLRGDTSSFRLDPDGWDAEIDMWYPGNSQFTISIAPPVGSPIVVPQGTDSGVIQTPAGSVRVDNGASGPNAKNGDYEVFMRFSGLSGSDTWLITVTDTGGTGGKYDAWIISGSAEFIGGDSSSTIDEPGNAHDVITVGSFNTKAVWDSLSGQQNYLSSFPLHVLSSFSSQGPTRDGRAKPDLCAPGAWISAALSSDALWQGYLVNPDGVHTMELGTSMAAPHVAGAAALLLSINPKLSAEDVRTLLIESASQDGFTGGVPNPRWGWGKLNVAAAVAAVGSLPPPEEPPVTPDETAPQISLAENPVSSVARFLFEFPTGISWARIHIYAANGMPVFNALVHPSAEQMEWSLTTTRGETVASGLYLYVLVTDRGVSEIGKLVIAR